MGVRNGSSTVLTACAMGWYIGVCTRVMIIFTHFRENQLERFAEFDIRSDPPYRVSHSYQW